MGVERRFLVFMYRVGFLVFLWLNLILIFALGGDIFVLNEIVRCLGGKCTVMVVLFFEVKKELTMFAGCVRIKKKKEEKRNAFCSCFITLAQF